MAIITRGDRKLKRLPLTVTSIESDFYVKMFASDGDDMGISRTDFITALSALGLGGSSSGSDSTIDCGDRMTGNEIINMGQRV